MTGEPRIDRRLAATITFIFAAGRPERIEAFLRRAFTINTVMPFSPAACKLTRDARAKYCVARAPLLPADFINDGIFRAPGQEGIEYFL